MMSSDLPYAIVLYDLLPADAWWISRDQFKMRIDLMDKCVKWCMEYPFTDWYINEEHCSFHFRSSDMLMAFKLTFDTKYA